MLNSELYKYLKYEEDELIEIIENRARVSNLSSDKMDFLYRYDAIPFDDPEDRENHNYDLGRLNFIKNLKEKLQKSCKCYIITAKDGNLFAILAKDLLSAIEGISDTLDFKHLVSVDEIPDLDFYRYRVKGSYSTLDELFTFDSHFKIYIVEKIA